MTFAPARPSGLRGTSRGSPGAIGLSMITAGRRERLRRVVIAIVVFAVFMHFVAYWMVGALCRRRRSTSRCW